MNATARKFCKNQTQFGYLSSFECSEAANKSKIMHELSEICSFHFKRLVKFEHSGKNIDNAYIHAIHCK